jgi:transposase
VSHRNAPLSYEGRLRLVQRCQNRPIAHVAAEMGISRACASKWINRWRRFGELGLHDRSSTPHESPNATPTWVIEQIESWRREQKWSATRITHELAELGFQVNRRTVTRHLTRLGLGHRRFLDPCGEGNRKPGKILARWPGHMVHLDVKKVGRIPDGGGWRVHGRDSDQHRAVDRAKTAGARRGYVYCTRSSTGSPGSPTPSPSPTRRAPPPPRSWPGRRSGSPSTASPTSTASSPTTAPATAQPTSPASSAPGPGTRRRNHSPHATTGRPSATSASSPRKCSTPRVPLRGRTRGRDPCVEHPLQLPSTPQRRGRPTACIPAQDRRHQRPALKPSSPGAVVVGAPGEALRGARVDDARSLAGEVQLLTGRASSR